MYATARFCKLEECAEPFYAKGYCQIHYYADYRVRVRRMSHYVPIERAQPILDRLFQIYPRKTQVADALGMGHREFRAMRKNRYIQQRTFDRLLGLINEHEEHLRGKGGMPLEVVSAPQLSQILRAWSVIWMQEHPTTELYNGVVTGPTAVIAARSGISARTVSRWMNNSTGAEYVDVYVADKLLDAIDESFALVDGRLPVIPNPQLSMESWVRRMEAKGCI